MTLFRIHGNAPAAEFYLISYHHRVHEYRVPDFLSGRPNWVPPPTLSPVSEPPPPFGSKGGDTRLRGRRWGDPIPTKGQTLKLRKLWSPENGVSRLLGLPSNDGVPQFTTVYLFRHFLLLLRTRVTNIKEIFSRKHLDTIKNTCFLDIGGSLKTILTTGWLSCKIRYGTVIITRCLNRGKRKSNRVYNNVLKMQDLETVFQK